MGKGPVWSPKERETAALAWFRATNNGNVGADRKSEDYQDEIYALFKLHAPSVHKAGIYKDRSSKAVYHCLQDKIFPDINKFNESLRLVQSSNPTGVNYDNIISMAIALHVKKEVTRMDYNLKDFDHNKWPNYLAWKILRESPKYRPPSRNTNEQEEAPSVNNTTTIMPNNSYNLPYAAAGNVVETPMAETQPMAAISSGDATTSSFSASTFPGFSFDPSRGGRGAAMGQKKAKREYEKQIAEDRKEKRFKKIEESIRAQTMAQTRVGRIYELRQLSKLAITMKNKSLIKKINKEMLTFLKPASSNITEETEEQDDEESDDSVVLTSIPENRGRTEKNDGDDDDSYDDEGGATEIPSFKF
jgi:hypothetical protein